MSTNQRLFFVVIAYAGSCFASASASFATEASSLVFALTVRRALDQTHREMRAFATQRECQLPEITNEESAGLARIYQNLPLQTASDRQRLCRELFHQATLNRRVTTAIFLHNLIELTRWDLWIANSLCLDASGNTPLHNAVRSGSSFLTAFLLHKDVQHMSNLDKITAKNKQGMTPLHEAAKGGHFEIARLFVKTLKNAEQYDINIVDAKGHNPLHYAAMSGSQDVVYLLLKYGADLNAQTIHGDTSLHIATRHNHLHIVRQLIQYKAKINAQNNSKMTPLCIASSHNYHEIVNFLLLKGADPSIECQISTDTETPLHVSALHGGIETVERLVEAGASVNSEDNQGRTPLYFAARDGHLSVVEHLLENGAEVDGFDPFFGMKVFSRGAAFLKQAFDGHKTPLLVAVSQGKIDIVRYLVRNGASFYPQSDGATPFILAIKHKNNDIAEYLFDCEKPSQDTLWIALRTACACDNESIVPFLLRKIDAGSFSLYRNPLRKTVDGRTILHIAVECGCKGIVDLLCKEDPGLIERTTTVDFWSTGVERKEQNADAGSTPLHLAARWGDPELKNREMLTFFLPGCKVQISMHNVSQAVARTLLENGAQVNCKHEYTGKTPLHYAAKLGNKAVVEILTSHNAEVDSMDNEEKTPLYYALVNNHLNTAFLLFQHGAKVDPEQCYPLHAVTEIGLEKCLDFLLIGRAEIDRTDKNGETALHIAAKNGQLELAEFLVNKGANTRIKNKWGQTAFDVATLYKDNNIANYLAKRLAHIQHASPEECVLVKLVLQGKKDVNEREDWEKNTCLHFAAQHGSTQLAKFLIESGARVNTQNRHGQLPIHIAAAHGNMQLVEALLRAKSGDIADKENKRPRMLAFEAGQHQLVAFLYRHRARKEGREISREEKSLIRDFTQNKHRITEADALYANTALHRAAHNDHRNVALFLLENGADKEAQNRYGETAAHVAAQKGKTDILELLHAHGVDLNARDHEGNTPIHLAAKHDKQKSVRCLTSFASVAIDTKNNEGKTALYFAVEGELDDVVSLLMDQCKARGEDLTAMVNSTTKKNETALHAAAQMGHYGPASMLIENGAYVSIKNLDGQTPLECAIEKRNPEIVKLLLDREGYVKTVTRAVASLFSASRTTLVHHAAKSGNLEILYFLISRGYKLEEHDENGNTPLHLAAFHGYCSFVKELLDMGAAIDAVNKKGRTPLHQAVIGDNLDVVELLVRQHAVIIHEDVYGNTPLHYAAARNHVDVAQFLLQKGAPKNIKDKTGHTPLARARSNGHHEVMQLLLAA